MGSRSGCSLRRSRRVSGATARTLEKAAREGRERSWRTRTEAVDKVSALLDNELARLLHRAARVHRAEQDVLVIREHCAPRSAARVSGGRRHRSRGRRADGASHRTARCASLTNWTAALGPRRESRRRPARACDAGVGLEWEQLPLAFGGRMSREPAGLQLRSSSLINEGRR